MMSENKMKNALPAGTTLVSADGRTYTLVRVLGIGGFGITYLGKMHARVGNINAEISVAVKEFFPSDLCERSGATSAMSYSNPNEAQVRDARKAFMAEARRLNALSGKHPNIVAVNEVFEANNTVYYVMEYIDGQSLKQYIELYGPLSESAMLGIMCPVVDAVALLHSEKITHLDIKPANIMLAVDDKGLPVRTTLVDFGLSKHYDDSGGATSTLNISGISPGYAPREQYGGITTFTPAADVYSLAATMLYCITGQRLPSSLDLTDASLAVAIPASVSPALRSVLLKALALHKDDRLPHAGSLLLQLDKLKTRGADDEDTVRICLGDDDTQTPVAIVPKPEKPVKKASTPRVASARATKKRYAVPSPSYHHLDLAVRDADGTVGYFSQDTWEKADKKRYEKLGIVIDSNNCPPFLWSLECTEPIAWRETIRSYGKRCLPTKRQCEAIISQCSLNNVQKIILKYGGVIPSLCGYWGRGSVMGVPWPLQMGNSYCQFIDKKEMNSVRSVIPIP